MAKARKFGWFGGVFTPSILTILGVIMYLRLPSIVGQAGLFTSIGIIAVAHVISVCTGLSVASIATDKKVEAGGTYYMISRSLGLPIGGTLGLALFVGLSFSVSLYVIGFSESFLGYWGLSVDKDMIRLTGSITLLAVTIVTFLSTSLALKAQFYIMAAIALSLVSIVAGSHDFVPTAATPSVVAQGTSFIVLFGIFFPAVTGFEAGVSMSGDLKNPKKAIPVGTILAIVVGLVVYIALAAFLSLTVSAEALSTNPAVLLDISRFPVLVIAGIWGATISSALGSILGAPRILQATAVDRITPRIFGKGFGPSNEPRNALLVTFVIAEVGILIGELDVIARIVSMFFITTYGFLNLSCAIERWASPDFRPEFKVPAWVSLLGSVACFVVMIQLDLLAMLAATVVLGTLYLALTRRQLTLASGDTWEGVWSSISRIALSRLVVRQVHQRNWRPNILLFAGSQGRGHLRNLGDWLAYRRGLVSNVELVAKPGSERATRPVPVETPEARVGFFTHRVECQDFATGMVDVARLHGFAGVAPNTVLVGWSRRTREPDEFHHALDSIVEMDLNLLVLDYDTERDYGDFRTIDVWLEGGGRNVSLALALVRFLTSADAWQRASVRLLRWHEGESVFVGALRDSMQGLVEAQRLNASVQVVQAMPGETFAEAVQRESGESALTLIGLPEAGRLSSDAFVRQTNNIIDTIGTVLLLRASSSFGELTLGDFTHDAHLLPGASQQDSVVADAAQLVGDDVELKEEVGTLQEKLLAIVSTLESELAVVESLGASLVTDTVELLRGTFFNLGRSLPTADRPRRARALDREAARLLFRGREILVGAGGETVESQARTLTTATGLAARMLENQGSALPTRLSRVPGVRRALRLRSRFEEDLLPRLLDHLAQSVQRFDARAEARLAAAVRLQGALADALDRMAEDLEAEDSDAQAVIDRERQALGLMEREMLAALDRTRAADLDELRAGMMRPLSEWVAGLAASSRGRTAPARLPKARTEEMLARLRDVGSAWRTHQEVRLDEAELQARLRAAGHRMEIVLDRAMQDVRIETETTLRGLAALGTYLEALESATEVDHDQNDIPDVSTTFDGQAVVARIAGELRAAVDELPEEWRVSAELDGAQPSDPLEPADTRVVGIRAAADYRLQASLVTALEPRLLDLGVACLRGGETAHDVTRLVRFASSQDEQADLEASFRSVLKLGGARVSEARERIVDALESVTTSAIAGLRGVEPQLEAGALAAIGLQGDGGRRSGAPWWGPTFDLLTRARRSLTQRLVGIWYRRSRGVILSERLRAGERAGRTPVDRLLGLVEGVSPTPDVLAHLPFYYRQLFLEHTVATRDFWVARPRVDQRIELAMDRFKRGYEGGLLVVGDPGSGKSSLVARIANRAPGIPVLRVPAPSQATSDIAVFQDHLRRTLGSSGDIDAAFARLPAGTPLVVDDLDQWWERRSGGLEVVEYLLGLMDRFGGRCLFIVTVTTVTESLLRQLVRLEERFLASVHLDPFTAEQLRDIVLVRHRSTGMGLLVDGRPTQGMVDWRLARFFNQLFDRTRGNVGEALRAWIASIESVEDETVHIRTPETPRLSPLRELKPRQRALTGALMIHRRLPADGVGRLTGLDPVALAEEIAALRRSGLIEETNGVFVLNPYIEPDLRRELQTRGVV
ncbi:MAG: AAA family ATPase [Gemmatimonadota bacterium]|nr:AAA family ATPase [Gemmatimonadota bacterium]